MSKYPKCGNSWSPCLRLVVHRVQSGHMLQETEENNHILVWYVMIVWMLSRARVHSPNLDCDKYFSSYCRWGVQAFTTGRTAGTTRQFLMWTKESGSDVKCMYVDQRIYILIERTATPCCLKLRRHSLLCLQYTALPVCLYNCRQSKQGEPSQFMMTGGYCPFYKDIYSLM